MSQPSGSQGNRPNYPVCPKTQIYLEDKSLWRQTVSCSPNWDHIFSTVVISLVTPGLEQGFSISPMNHFHCKAWKPRWFGSNMMTSCHLQWFHVVELLHFFSAKSPLLEHVFISKDVFFTKNVTWPGAGQRLQSRMWSLVHCRLSHIMFFPIKTHWGDGLFKMWRLGYPAQ